LPPIPQHYVPKPPSVARNILEKETSGKPQSVVSLEKPSPMMMMCLKIEATCALCKATIKHFFAYRK
jgi:hypothetical protein